MYPPPPPPPPPQVIPQPVLVPSPVKPRINVRNKGQRGEREVIDLLQRIVNDTRWRLRLQPIVLQRNTLQAHLGGCDVHGLKGFSIEVKFQEEQNVPAWWKQCLAQAAKLGGVPVLFYRRSRQDWTVKFRAYVNTPEERDQIEMDLTVSLTDFEAWFAEAYDESCVTELQLLK